MTATRAAAALDDNVPNCSFHLRQLAKYGFAERAPGADARERPWRATTRMTSWDDDSDDPAMRAATDQLDSVLLGVFTQRAQDCLAARADEPTEWRAAAGFGDALVHVTAAELRDLVEQMEALTERFAEQRRHPPDRRSDGRLPRRGRRRAAPALWIATVGALAGALWIYFSPLRTMRELPDL